MINASKYYDESNKEFKAPGQWVSLKSTKQLIDEDKKSRFYNKKSNEYFFSEELMSSYKEYSQSEVKQEVKKEVKTEVMSEEWFEIIYKEAKDFFSAEDFKYIESKAFQSLLGVALQYLYKDLAVKNPWELATKEVKEAIGGFLAPVLVECKSYTRKFDKHYLDIVSGKYNEALSRHLVISRTKTLFQGQDFKVVINHKNNVVKV